MPAPEARERPLLLVDVDGVLSLFGAGVDRATCTPALVEGIPHLLSRSAAVLLTRLAARYECVWCTGWEDRADGHLPHLLGLPAGWPHLAFSDRPEDAAHWKLRAIDAYAGPRRPTAWVDDAHDERCRAWAAGRPGPTLLVTTDPAVGLTREQAAQLEAWAA
jgi:Swiss Army Knife RNA repair-like protein